MTSGGRIAVDAMGGDHAPEAVVRGAVLAVRQGIPVTLVGDTARLAPLIPDGVQVPIVHASDVVGMEESAVGAVRRRPDSSLRVALQLLADGKASAVVSCGNTGALLVGAVLTVGVLEVVERPPIATVLPRSDGGQLVLLDVGANVDCRAEQLACFALLGAAWAEVLGIESPRVGVLSNGHEHGKGNALARETLALVQELSVRGVGFVEPSSAFAGACDVLVCDGFVGNAIVKAVEGAADVVTHLLGQQIQSSLSARAGALLMKGAFEGFQRAIRWDSYGGGLLLGTKGVVVAAHGRSNEAAVAAAIDMAHRAARDGLVANLQSRLGALGAPRRTP